MPEHTNKTRSPLGLGSETMRLILMAAALAGMVFLVVFFRPGEDSVDTGRPRYFEDTTPVPELDDSKLALARDSTREERLVLDEEPFRHLLEKSLHVTPTVARKLGLPDRPVPIERLRSNPGTHRGQYLWYKGQLEYLSRPNEGHPVPNYSYYEGRLVTSEGEPVLFAFSVPPAEPLAIGDWVRIEGFFFGLQDAHFPVPLDRAPMLVGPELFPAYADWNAVDELDPTVLGQVNDGWWDPNAGGRGDFVDAPDIEKMLDESQDTPLWHLASFARAERERRTEEYWKGVPVFAEKAQFERFRDGLVARGTPMRILGIYRDARVLPARPNPLGLEAWTEVWVQVRDLGGKIIPVWVPEKIADDWRLNQTAICNAYFFKIYKYATREGEIRWTPLFVAGSLDRFELGEQLLTTVVTFSFAGVIGAVGLVLFVLVRRDRRHRREHEESLLQRRKRRRTTPSVSDPACSA